MNLSTILLHLAVFTSVISATFASSTTPINSAEIQDDLFGTLVSYELLGTGLLSPDFAEGMQIISPAAANMHNADQSAQRAIEDTLMQTLCLQFGEQEYYIVMLLLYYLDIDDRILTSPSKSTSHDYITRLLEQSSMLHNSLERNCALSLIHI